MKRWMSLLLACCLLLAGAAAAETAAMPVVKIDLGEQATLDREETVDGMGYMAEYTLETTKIYLMVMHDPVTVDDMARSLSMTEPVKKTLVLEEGGLQARRIYTSELDNMVLDASMLAYGEYSVVLMQMTEVATYNGAGRKDLMTGWLEGMTIDGKPVVGDLAAAEAATEAKLADEAAEIADALDSGEMIAIPKVGISFGGEGVLVDESGVEGAFMQTYQVGDITVYLMAYLGEYLCDGVWQSFAFELPENQLVVENENGIRQRKTYDYAQYAHTGDVTVVWHNGCTIALVASVANDVYEAGLGDEITSWLETLTIDGEAVITPAE